MARDEQEDRFGRVVLGAFDERTQKLDELVAIDEAWLGLGDVVVEPVGDLAEALTTAARAN